MIELFQFFGRAGEHYIDLLVRGYLCFLVLLFILSLSIIIAACKDVHAGTLSASLQKKLSKEAMFLCNEAAYGAGTAAGADRDAVLVG